MGVALLVAGVVACPVGGFSKTAAATPTPTPVPSPSVAPSVAPTATPEGTPEVRNYNGAQQSQYIQTARTAYIDLRAAKTAAFAEANDAYVQAGGASAKGLTSKEAVTARRAMIQKAIQANDDYLAFVTTQDETYRAELAKTPLVKSDIDGLVSEYAATSKEDKVKELRKDVGALLKTGDDMMAVLEKEYGSWKPEGNAPKFKGSGDAKAYSALGKKYNGLVANVQKLTGEINTAPPVPEAVPSPGTPAASPAASVAPAVSPVPTAKPKA